MRAKISSPRPSTEETAAMLGVSRKRTHELISLVDAWVEQGSRTGNGKVRRATPAQKRAAKAASTEKSSSWDDQA